MMSATRKNRPEVLVFQSARAIPRNYHGVLGVRPAESEDIVIALFAQASVIVRCDIGLRNRDGLKCFHGDAELRGGPSKLTPGFTKLTGGPTISWTEAAAAPAASLACFVFSFAN